MIPGRTHDAAETPGQAQLNIRADRMAKALEFVVSFVYV